MEKNSNSSAILTPSYFKIYVQDNSVLYAHAVRFIF